MKFKNPKREIREKEWTRLPTPTVLYSHSFREKLKAHESTGHYWVNPILTHWWVEKEEDAVWLQLSNTSVKD